MKRLAVPHSVTTNQKGGEAPINAMLFNYNILQELPRAPSPKELGTGKTQTDVFTSGLSRMRMTNPFSPLAVKSTN
jgi:hypothetical protein